MLNDPSMKPFAAAVFAAVVLVSGAAGATGEDTAGTFGHVTAYAKGGKTVVAVEVCPTRQSAPDYAACGEPFRARVKEEMCRGLGRGEHAWFYQAGAGPLVHQTAVCR